MRPGTLPNRQGSFDRPTEACGGDPQASGRRQKLTAAVRKLTDGGRSLRRRSASFRLAAEACGGGPQASGRRLKLAAAVRKLTAGGRSLRRRSASFRLATEAVLHPVSAGGAARRLPVDGTFPAPRSFRLAGLVLRMTAWRLCFSTRSIACGKPPLRRCGLVIRPPTGTLRSPRMTDQGGAEGAENQATNLHWSISTSSPQATRFSGYPRVGGLTQ